MKHRLPILVLILCSCGCANMAVQDDSWTGRDKFHHFWVSGVISGGAAAILKDQDVDDADQLPIAVGVALSFGVAKETYDIHARGGWSWKDLAWDIVGALTGFAVVEALD